MLGPFKVRVHTGSVPLQLDIDADSFAYSAAAQSVMFYRGTRIAHVIGLAHLLDIRGEVEPEPEVNESEAVVDHDEDDRPERGEYDEPTRGFRGSYL